MGNNARRQTTAVQARRHDVATIQIIWNDRSKLWELVALDSSGRVVARDRADTTAELDRGALRDVLSSVRNRLEALLF